MASQVASRDGGSCSACAKPPERWRCRAMKRRGLRPSSAAGRAPARPAARRSSPTARGPNSRGSRCGNRRRCTEVGGCARGASRPRGPRDPRVGSRPRRWRSRRGSRAVAARRHALKLRPLFDVREDLLQTRGVAEATIRGAPDAEVGRHQSLLALAERDTELSSQQSWSPGTQWDRSGPGHQRRKLERADSEDRPGLEPPATRDADPRQLLGGRPPRQLVREAAPPVVPQSIPRSETLEGGALKGNARDLAATLDPVLLDHDAERGRNARGTGPAVARARRGRVLLALPAT